MAGRAAAGGPRGGWQAAVSYRGGVSQRRSAGSGVTGASSTGSVSSYPGERLGLPRQGTGAIAGFGARVIALFIDWAICTVIALTALQSRWWTYAIFAAEVYLLTALTGFTVGKRVVGARVVRLDGRPAGFGWALVRTILLLAVIPVFIVDRDMRGLHDRAANTVVVKV
jgi:RDD family